MTELRVNIPDGLKKQAEESNVDLSRLLAALVKREVLKWQLLKGFKSKEEQDLIKWSVELGREAKKGRFKRLLSELPPKKREELLNKLSPGKRRKISSE
ncbi:MAG: hypothetical protein AABY02_03325 [Nanoarchaeota archaeon]